jgi:hypothetical protein
VSRTSHTQEVGNEGDADETRDDEQKREKGDGGLHHNRRAGFHADSSYARDPSVEEH